jgi:hypothetical protein
MMRALASFSLFFTVLPGLATAHPGDHSRMSASGLAGHLAHDPFHLATLAVALIAVAGLVSGLVKWRK